MARSLGYGPVQAWLKVVLPQVYPQIRLPVYAVLAYSLSVVDMAIVLGPTTPPTLAALVLPLVQRPDLAMRFQAAAGAALQLGIVVLAIALWRALEALARPAGQAMAGPWRPRRQPAARPALAAWAGIAVLFGCSLGSLLGLALWSVAGRWRFPDALPQSLVARRAGRISSRRWRGRPGRRSRSGSPPPASRSLLVAGCLENESRRQRRPGAGALALLYMPLLVPQIGFLFGVQVLFLWLGLDDGWLAVIWSHLLFVLPYVFLTLADPYRSLDPRYARSALALGKPPWLVWLQDQAGDAAAPPSDRRWRWVSRSASRSSCRPCSPAAAASPRSPPRP